MSERIMLSFQCQTTANLDNSAQLLLMLNNIKHYQTRHLANEATLVNFFYHEKIRRLLKDEDSAKPLLDLTAHLNCLINAVPKDKSSWLYKSSQQAVLESLRLAKQLLLQIVHPGQWVSLDSFQEKVTYFSETVRAATEVVQHPFSTAHATALQLTTSNMRDHYESSRGRDAYDNPSFNRFASLMEMIAANLLILAGAIMLMTLNIPAGILGALNIAYATSMLYSAAQRLARTFDSAVCLPAEEKLLAKQSADSHYAFTHLANSHLSFFVKKSTKANAPVKSVVPAEIELTLFKRSA